MDRRYTGRSNNATKSEHPMPVRQMKLRFDAKPTTRVVPSRLVPEPPQGKGERGNQQTSGAGTPAPILGVAGLPPPKAPPPGPRN